MSTSATTYAARIAVSVTAGVATLALWEVVIQPRLAERFGSQSESTNQGGWLGT